MKRHPSWEAWSAWVDGESADVEAMRMHLEQCAACTAQVKALETLASEVHRLPDLEVHPAFVTRVMAHVAETTP
ncbi:MAG: hypothetical protein NTU83_12320, partial [Candidatus Hydrogenedentes bacterium]|nr:hypothetical protein [Candidatus Hydrogenedentota bacterium]